MAGLRLCEEVVHEIDIAHQGGVPERSVDWVRRSAADQRVRTGAPAFCDLLATGLDRAGTQCGDGAAPCVQDVDWQLPAGFGREVGKGSAGGILGESFDLGHGSILRFLLSELISSLSGR